MIVLLCKVYPILEEKAGKCVDFQKYFDFYVVFEMFRGERMRHRSLFIIINVFVNVLKKETYFPKWKIP